MLFNSAIFLFAFLPVVFALFWLSRTKWQRYLLLTISSFVFYGWWNWRFCFLLLFSSLTSYFTAILIERAPALARKRFWLGCTVSLDLALLGFFKYYNFFASTVRDLVPGTALPVLDVVLPIGISFYTFHTISYVVDVYAGRVRAAHSLFEYFTYVSLFSQLVAGPIVRFRQIEHDLEHIDGPPRESQMALGVGFFVVGLIKKVIVADVIASYSDPLIASYASLTVGGAWLAALGYTFQIYFDFSGYSDMAVGLGHLFGIHIPQNFDQPYQAASLREFWRRWHISLSSWLRDYLYIPLGGSRGGIWRTHFNLMMTMLLGGLWHGANWTFVLWGGYHGALLILERVLDKPLAAVPQAIKRAATFLLVVVSWVLFRSQNLEMAWVWLQRMSGIRNGTIGARSGLVGWVIVLLLFVNLTPDTFHWRWGTSRRWAVVYAVGFWLAYLYMNSGTSPFLYYQF